MLMSIGLRIGNIYTPCKHGAMQILGTGLRPNMKSQILRVLLQKLSITDLMPLIVLSGVIRLRLKMTILFLVEGEQGINDCDRT